MLNSWYSNTESATSFPSSNTRKSSFVNPVTGLPSLAFTVTLTTTSWALVSNFNSCANSAATTNRAGTFRMLKTKPHDRLHGTHGSGALRESIVRSVYHRAQACDGNPVGYVVGLQPELNPPARIAQPESASNRAVHRK